MAERYSDKMRFIQALDDAQPFTGNICDIEVIRQGDSFIAKVRFEEERSIKEYKSSNFEGILEQIQINLQDKFEEQF